MSVFSQEKTDSINFSLGWNIGDCWKVGVYGFMENRKKSYNSDYQKTFTSIIEISVNDKWIEEEDTLYLIEFIGNYKAFWTLLPNIARKEKPKDSMYSLVYTLNINAERKKAKDGKIYRIDKDGRKYLRNIDNGYTGNIYQHYGLGDFGGLPIIIFPHFNKNNLYNRWRNKIETKDEADWCASYIPQSDTMIFHFQRRDHPTAKFFDDTKQYWAKDAKFWSRYVWYTHNVMNGRKIEFPALEAVLLEEHLAE